MAKISRVPQAEWDKYKNIVRDFLDVDAGLQPIIWRKRIVVPTPHGEDLEERYSDIPLMGLLGYNTFKTWPTNNTSVSGELDMQNTPLWISVRSIEEAGFINSAGYWEWDRSLDRFIIDGIVYKTSGDTKAAQAKDEGLLFMVVLKREERETLLRY